MIYQRWGFAFALEELKNITIPSPVNNLQKQEDLEQDADLVSQEQDAQVIERATPETEDETKPNSSQSEVRLLEEQDHASILSDLEPPIAEEEHGNEALSKQINKARYTLGKYNPIQGEPNNIRFTSLVLDSYRNWYRFN